MYCDAQLQERKEAPNKKSDENKVVSAGQGSLMWASGKHRTAQRIELGSYTPLAAACDGVLHGP